MTGRFPAGGFALDVPISDVTTVHGGVSRKLHNRMTQPAENCGVASSGRLLMTRSGLFPLGLEPLPSANQG
jgi:hypothetical protein